MERCPATGYAIKFLNGSFIKCTTSSTNSNTQGLYGHFYHSPPILTTYYILPIEPLENNEEVDGEDIDMDKWEMIISNE